MTDRIDTSKERKKLAGLIGFTPGPWRQGQNNPDRVSNGGEYIANCNPTHQSHPRTENNARLIASAPDLLATIHRLLDALDAERAVVERLEALAAPTDALERAIDAAVLAEREACARIADDMFADGDCGCGEPFEIAADIRARSDAQNKGA